MNGQNPLSIKWIIIGLAAIFLFLPRVVLAKIEITNSPSQIEINKEFKITVSLSNLSTPTHFLSIAIHKKSGAPYFGQTKNGDRWIEADDSNCQDFPQVEMSSGSWNGELTGRVIWREKDFDDSLGGYFLRIIKYTTSCSKSLSGKLPVELNATDEPTPTLTSSPISTATPTPTPTPMPAKATCKINEVKNEDGETLSNVKVYVDGVYLHHYAPEELTFCDGCKCDTYVDCGFGEHTIKLERSGYQNWEDKRNISAGDYHQINPVMNFTTSASAPASTPTPISNPTPILKAVKLAATLSGEVLGEGEEATAAFYPLEGTEEEPEEATPSSKSASRRTWLPKVFLVLGLITLFGAAFSLWYNFLGGKNDGASRTN